MKNIESVMNEMEKLIGREFNEDDIICCFQDNEEDIVVSEVEGYTSNFEGHGTCQLWQAYENKKDSEMFNVWVDDENIIVEIN